MYGDAGFNIGFSDLAMHWKSIGGNGDLYLETEYDFSSRHFHVVRFVYGGASQASQIYINGVLISEAHDQQIVIENPVYRIGASKEIASFNGALAEMLVFNGSIPTDLEMSALETIFCQSTATHLLALSAIWMGMAWMTTWNFIGV